MISASSRVSPVLDRARTTSPAPIIPRSPWLASAAWTNMAGEPVEASVAAILRATWPDLPTPVRMMRPLAPKRTSTARPNGSPRAAAMSPSARASASSTRRPVSMTSLAVKRRSGRASRWPRRSSGRRRRSRAGRKVCRAWPLIACAVFTARRRANRGKTALAKMSQVETNSSAAGS